VTPDNFDNKITNASRSNIGSHWDVSILWLRLAQSRHLTDQIVPAAALLDLGMDQYLKQGTAFCRVFAVLFELMEQYLLLRNLALSVGHVDLSQREISKDIVRFHPTSRSLSY
jgi:hypothetical protein